MIHGYIAKWLTHYSYLTPPLLCIVTAHVCVCVCVCVCGLKTLKIYSLFTVEQYSVVCMYVYTTFSIFLHSSMDTEVVFNFWLLWIMLQRTWVCSYLFKILISHPLDIHPEVELLDYMVALFLAFEKPSYCLKVDISWSQICLTYFDHLFCNQPFLRVKLWHKSHDLLCISSMNSYPELQNHSFISFQISKGNLSHDQEGIYHFL